MHKTSNTQVERQAQDCQLSSRPELGRARPAPSQAFLPDEHPVRSARLPERSPRQAGQVAPARAEGQAELGDASYPLSRPRR